MQRAYLGLALLAVLGPYACGGGGDSSSSGGGTSGGGVVWPSRDATPSRALPPAVVTGRIVFISQSGESCCVAIDPELISGSAQRGLAVLTDLAPGPATVRVAGFTTDFAPAVAGVVDTCTTVPASVARPCDPMRVAAPAFESAPINVTIIAGVQTNVGTVDMISFPFLFGFSPEQDALAPAPVQFALTVTDAINDIQPDSVNLEVAFTLPVENPTPGDPPFRSLSKRVPLTLTACRDGGPTPCSPAGNLELAGFHASGTAPELPEGEVEAHVTAENRGDPPQALDFRYPFVVLATATATGTATPPPAEGAADETADAVPAAGHRDDGPSSLGRGVAPADGDPPAARRAHPAGNGPAPTPTATPLPPSGV